MKNIIDLVEEVKRSPEFRAKFVGKDEAALEQMLKDEGYDVSMEEIAEAAGKIDIELTPEELEKIAGGKSGSSVAKSFATIFNIMCFRC